MASRGQRAGWTLRRDGRASLRACHEGHPAGSRTLSKMNDRLVWIDCEMTGLDIEHDALVEVACLVTDGELNLLDAGIDVIIKPPAEALDQMSDVVRTMHTTSGLLNDLAGGVTLAEAAQAGLSY